MLIARLADAGPYRQEHRHADQAQSQHRILQAQEADRCGHRRQHQQHDDCH